MIADQSGYIGNIVTNHKTAFLCQLITWFKICCTRAAAAVRTKWLIGLSVVPEPKTLANAGHFEDLARSMLIGLIFTLWVSLLMGPGNDHWFFVDSKPDVGDNIDLPTLYSKILKWILLIPYSHTPNSFGRGWGLGNKRGNYSNKGRDWPLKPPPSKWDPVTRQIEFDGLMKK